MQLFELKNEGVRENCLGEIGALELVPGNPFQVEIYTGKDLRSKRQNALYWKHVHEVAKAWADSDEETHYELKRKFLHSIFMRGSTKANIRYQDNYNALKTIFNSEAIDADGMRKLHKQILSTTDATVKQMRQYIEAYWVWINQQGIYLTDPSTLDE